MKKILLAVLAVIVLAILGVAIWLYSLESHYNVTRSIVINKSVDKVFPLVNNFKTWTEWSPWLCMEPDAKVDVTGSGSDIGDTYSWEGELVGIGTIEHLQLERNKLINQEIRFKTPMESKSDVYWIFESLNDSTSKVTWGMKGEMPFFARFMTKMMEPLIGMDYERGLKMIKGLAEKGYVASKVEIIGVVDIPEIAYLGKAQRTTFEDLGPLMQKAMYDVWQEVEKNNLKSTKGITLYTQFDIFNPELEFVAGGVLDEKIVASEGFISSTIDAGKAVKVVFTGDYEYIGNAWSAGMSYMQGQKIMQSQDYAGYELYITNPMDEPDSRKWISEIYIPVK